MAKKRIYGAGLDVGSGASRLVVCLLENERMRLLGCGAVPSQGWDKGRIHDQAAVTESIRAVLREVEAQAGIPVGLAAVGVGGPSARGANARGALELGYQREITQADVNRVVERASRVQLPEDRMVLQLFPQDFVVDDQPGHRDPRKMIASRLEINVHLVTALTQDHTTLVGAVNEASIEVEETVFEALAASYAAVPPEDRREGVALVDIGLHSTELVAYYGDSLYLASTLRLCGDHFTRDVAHALFLSYEEAETVKREYGCAQAGETPDNVYVELPGHDDREPRETQRRVLNRVLEARAEELFRYVRSELARVGMEEALVGGLFLAGGGALLPDLCDVSERVLGWQARFALPVGIEGWPDASLDPSWATAAGLAMYSAKVKLQKEREKRHIGLLERILR